MINSSILSIDLLPVVSSMFLLPNLAIALVIISLFTWFSGYIDFTFSISWSPNNSLACSYNPRYPSGLNIS